jgi:hypothetical protein
MMTFVVVLVVGFIVGAYLKKKDKTRKGNFAIIAIVIVSILGIIGNHMNSSSASSGGLFSSNASVDLGQVESNSASNELKEIKDSSWDSNASDLKDSDIKASVKGNTVLIRINTGNWYSYIDGLSQNTDFYERFGLSNFADDAGYVFKNYPDVNNVRMELWQVGSDKYGQSTPVTVMSMEMDKTTFKKMDWDTIKMQQLFTSSFDTSVFKDFYMSGE